MKNIIINCFPGESQRNTDLAGLKDLGKRMKGEETVERMEKNDNG